MYKPSGLSWKDDTQYIGHLDVLSKLKEENFQPKVIYDIGSCEGNWTEMATTIWPNCEFYLFDANEDLNELYKGRKYNYYLGLLSNTNDEKIKYYYNETFIAGNSYYKELTEAYTDDTYRILNSVTLDKVIDNNNWPLPDLIKMDVQGSELDILEGGKKILSQAKYLIVELQHIEYNDNAPLFEESIATIEKSGWKLINSKFSSSDYSIDADYLFERV